MNGISNCIRGNVGLRIAPPGKSGHIKKANQEDSSH